MSLNPDRSNAVRLDGATVEGKIYVFVRNSKTLDKVDFYLDGRGATKPPVRTDDVTHLLTLLVPRPTARHFPTTPRSSPMDRTPSGPYLPGRTARRPAVAGTLQSLTAAQWRLQQRPTAAGTRDYATRGGDANCAKPPPTRTPTPTPSCHECFPDVGADRTSSTSVTPTNASPDANDHQVSPDARRPPGRRPPASSTLRGQRGGAHRCRRRRPDGGERSRGRHDLHRQGRCARTRNFSVRPRSGDRFCGEPGAVLDGGRSLQYAFSGQATQRDPGLHHACRITTRAGRAERSSRTHMPAVGWCAMSLRCATTGPA